jgi:YfiH family protein
MDAAFLQPEWPAPAGVRALVTTRAAGELSALRTRVPLPAEPRWLRQVHGHEVVDLDLPFTGEPVADASITTRPATISVVRTADCLPVLFAAADGSAVAAAHAGWRGLASGVLENTVAALRTRVAPAVNLHAWMGPAIGPGHFEVGEEVRGAFTARVSGAEAAFVPGREGRWMCDLFLLARQRLAAAGITSVWGGGTCTYADADRFFSHRRDVQHRGLDATGRMASLVWLEA